MLGARGPLAIAEEGLELAIIVVETTGDIEEAAMLVPEETGATELVFDEMPVVVMVPVDDETALNVVDGLKKGLLGQECHHSDSDWEETHREGNGGARVVVGVRSGANEEIDVVGVESGANEVIDVVGAGSGADEAGDEEEVGRGGVGEAGGAEVEAEISDLASPREGA